MSTRLTITRTAATWTLTMEPPEGKPPTLDYDTMAAFESALAEIEAQAGDIACVVLRSASAKFFCAGANLKVMAAMDADSILPWVERGHRLMNRIEALPLPVLARVEGYALGGGLELAMACDVIFASDEARFGQPETKLGFVTGWGGGYRLARRVGLARAKELVFSGRILPADEAVRIGLAEWHGPAADLDRHVEEFLSGVAANGRVAVREMKAILAASAHTTIEEQAALEASASQRCLRTPDTVRRVQAFFRK